MSNEFLPALISRIARWALAAGFFYIAWAYTDLWFFYIFSAVAFITGFLVPERCIKGN